MGLPPIVTLLAAFAVLVSGRETSSNQQQQTPVDFDCPEEFGYYAHPTDCTQYYVCVFGGALLESCTGGLMYSHELQTCDWPRNVGCAPGQQQAHQQQEISQDTRQPLRQDVRQELRQEYARHELRQQDARQEFRQDPRHELRQEYRQVQEALRQPKQQQQILQQVVESRGRQRAQITVPKADLYNTEDEDLGPVGEDLEIDRQQRVYRGQPSTLGQVASDRDGLTHSNAIPVPATGGRDKLSVVSYGAQQQYNSQNKRTDGVYNSDHNFLTNTSRVRMKRDSPISYQQSPGEQPNQRRIKKQNRKKRQHFPKTTDMIMAGHNKHEFVNRTDGEETLGTQDQEDMNEEDNEEGGDEDGEDEEEEEEEVEEETDGEIEEEEGENNAEEEQSGEKNNKDKNNSQEDTKTSSEKANSEMESGETNKTSSSEDFKVDFPDPPASWESFEDFKSSFDDIDFDVEKFLEELKTDSFDGVDIFGNGKKTKRPNDNIEQSEVAGSGLKPATIAVPVIPGYKPPQVKFELFFPRPNSSAPASTNNDQLSNILPMSTAATATTVEEQRSLMVAVPSTQIIPQQYIPSMEFSGRQISILQTLPVQKNGGTENNNKEHQVVPNRRSHEEHPRSLSQQGFGERSRATMQRMWRGRQNPENTQPMRGHNRGNARFTLKRPPFAMSNTTPKYNGEIKSYMEAVNPTSAYGERSSHQPQPGTSSLRHNAKPTGFAGNEEYRYTYTTHYNSAFHRPKQVKMNDMQALEATTPRLNFGRILQPSENNQNGGYYNQPANGPYERSPQERNPNYRRGRQDLNRRQNRGNKYYRLGSISENLIGQHSTTRPMTARNPNLFDNNNNNVMYPTNFNAQRAMNQKQVSESNSNLFVNTPSKEYFRPIIFTINQPNPTPEIKHEQKQIIEELYYQNKHEPSNAGSTSLQPIIEISNGGTIKNSSRDETSTNGKDRSLTYPNIIGKKPALVVSPIYNIAPPLLLTNNTAISKSQVVTRNNKFDSIKYNNSEMSDQKVLPLEKLDATIAYSNHMEGQKQPVFNDPFNPTDSYGFRIISALPPNHKAAEPIKPHSSPSTEPEYQNEQSQPTKNESKGQTDLNKIKQNLPGSYMYINQKIGPSVAVPVKKIAIYNNIPTEDVSNESYNDYYNDYDEEDYEDPGNQTMPKPPSIPKTLQNIDYQEFEDSEYDDYSDEESEYEDDPKDSGNETGSGEDIYDEEEEGDEEEVEAEAEETKGQEGSMERPQGVTPRPGCIFAGKAPTGQKRLLCPRKQSTDKPTTTADDQTNSEQTRRTITLLRASVQPAQQQTYDTRGYNTSRYIQQPQQQQYTDPNYYTIYDEEAEQYKDIGDYAQYIQQTKQDIYTRKKPAVEIVQQEPVQQRATYQKSKYSSQPENIYQSVTPQEYDTYSIQNNDDLYRQVQTKSNNRFPEVKELGSTPGERRLITLSAGPLPTDTPTRTDRVGSGFHLESAQTESSVVNITPRKRGRNDAPLNGTSTNSNKAASFAQEVNALAPSLFTEDPVSKVLEALTKSGEYLSDEASIEQSKELNQVSTESSRRGKSPLTVEEIDIAQLKNLNVQSTPASRFRIASTSQESPFIKPVIDLNQFGIGQNSPQPSTTPSAVQAQSATPYITKEENKQHTRNEAQVPKEHNEKRKPFVVNFTEEKNLRSISSQEYEQQRRQNTKQEYSNGRLRGTVKHHNSGEILYTDPASEQDYSDQSGSQELPKEWRQFSVTPSDRDQTKQTTKAPETISIVREQPQFRPVTSVNTLTTPLPPRKVDSPTHPETISLVRTHQRASEEARSTSFAVPQQFQRKEQSIPRKSVNYETTTQQLRVIGMRASFNLHPDLENARTTTRPLLIRIPEMFRERSEGTRKIEVASIRVNNLDNVRVVPEREKPQRESFNTVAAKPEDSEPTSEEARRPISIRIPDYLPKSHDSDESHETLSGRKKQIKSRGEEEYERAKPAPIRYIDSMEYNTQIKDDSTRNSNRFRDSSRETGSRYETETMPSRGQAMRLREYLNAVTAPESSTEDLQPKILQSYKADTRQRVNPNQSSRSREQANTQEKQEVARPASIRVPDSSDLNHYRSSDEKTSEVSRTPGRNEETSQRRGEHRSRVRLTEPERTPDRSSELWNRFEVATTLRPTNRLTIPLTTKTFLSRPPKKFRNGTIYADQTLPIGTDTTDSPPSAEPDPSIRARPTSNNTPSTPGLTRGNQRHRGSHTYTLSPNEAEPAPVATVATSPPRGTLPPNRGRPTLKPSTTVVSKAAEFVDIYRFPPRRPENVYPTPQVDKTAAKCRKDVCLLPDCYCGGKEIPGELSPEETPQIVLLTFDDSVNDLNKGLYSDLFDKGRVNPNGCPISATFYVSHEWTDYSQVQNLYAGGHEIASHSVSHSFGEQFSQKKWTREIAGQREILSAYGGVKLEDVRGMRAPFLAVGGNKMFKMLYDSNFTYDSSMPVYENRPPSWPYTLDYKVFHDCMIPPCPTKSYPGIWEVPMVMWQDLNGGRCSMGDACSNPPNADGVYKMLIKNFERHFTTNRSPFGLFYHAAWFTQPHHKEGFISFLDTINKMPEVWLITNWQAIQWVRDPTPLSRLGSFAPFQCNYQDRPKKCNNPKVCNLWHKSGVRYMRTCQACPEVYPWTGKSGVRNSRVDNDLE